MIITTDDPFGGAGQSAQLTHIAPWTVELSGKVFSIVLAAVSAGKTAHQLVANLRAVLVSAPNAKAALVQ